MSMVCSVTLILKNEKGINKILTLHACMLSHFICVQLCVTVACHAPLSIGFSRQEYWSELPCPPPRDLSDPGMEPLSPATPEFHVGSLQLSHQGSPYHLEAYFLGCVNDHV